MKRLLNKYKENFIDYIMMTIKNKVVAIGLVIIGLASLPVLDEGTFLLLTILVGLVLFFTKDDIFEEQ